MLDIPTSLACRYQIGVDRDDFPFINCRNGRVYRVRFGRFRFEVYRECISRLKKLRLRELTIGDLKLEDRQWWGLCADNKLTAVLDVLEPIGATAEVT